MMSTIKFLLPVLVLSPFLLHGGTARAECNGTCLEGKRCQAGASQTPPDHLGSHPCGGSYANEFTDGSCVSSTSSKTCTLEQATVSVGQYVCSGTTTCTHTLIGTTSVQGCNC